jgi:Tol biopolymer transport system component
MNLRLQSPALRLLVALCAGLSSAMVAFPARAAPSADRPLDRLVYTSTRDGQVDIWSANSDGSDQVRLTTDPAHDTHPDVSADGNKIAFIRGEGVLKGSTPTYAHLWVMDADGGNARPVLADPLITDYRPDFSPDGGRILVSRFTDVVGAVPELWVVNSDGTNANRWATNANYGSWAPDGVRIAYVHLNLPDIQIWATDTDGSTTQLTFKGRNVAPQWSPDGTRIVFTSYRNGRGEVWMMNADGTDQHRVVGSAGKDGLATWSPDGERIAFASTRHTPCPPELTELCPHRIYTIATDGSDLRPFADNALSDMYPVYATRAPAPTPSEGRIVYSGNRGAGWDLYVAGADGSNERPLATSPLDDITPDVSPDGTLVVFARGLGSIPQGPDLDLWIAKVDGSGEWPLLDDPTADDYMPKWSPDGRTVAFTRHPNPLGGFFVGNDENQVHVIDVGTREVRKLTSNGAYNGFPAWTRDGGTIAFHSSRDDPAGLALGIYLMDADGHNQRRLSPAGVSDYNADFSHDGQWIAFRSALPGGTPDIWKMRIDGTGREQLTSNAAWNGFPAWSPDDTHIVFHSNRAGCPGGTATWSVCSQIWRIGADGGSPTALTAGSVGSLYPRYVPEP